MVQPAVPNQPFAVKPPAAPITKTQAARTALGLLTGSGWNMPQACGVIANIEAESSFNIDAIGDGGTAFGLCQWHPDRQRNFARQFGHAMQSSDFNEQVAFITFEMTKGNEIEAGNHLKQIGSAIDAGRAVSMFYERPKDSSGSVRAHRGKRADFWFQTLSGQAPIA